MLDDVGCNSLDLFLVRDAGGAVAAVATLDLVLRAGGWFGRWTCGGLSCRRLRRTAVRWCAARLASCGIGLVGGIVVLLCCCAAGTLGTAPVVDSTLGTDCSRSTLGTGCSSMVCCVCNFDSTCCTIVLRSARL